MWADFVYRGKPIGVVEFDRNVDRSDWRLIHKRDEKEFVKCDQPFVSRRIPSKVPLPPLQRYDYQVKVELKSRPNFFLTKSFSWIKQKQLREGKNPDDIPMYRMVHYADDEHKFLNKFIELSDDLMKPDSSIYDVDPNPYLDLYGEHYPVKVEGWNSAEKFVIAAADNNIFLNED